MKDLTVDSLLKALQTLSQTGVKPLDPSQPMIVLPPPRIGYHWDINGDYAIEVKD